ncbi:MAG: HAD family hydrolase, partial [Candidatus Omnitrophota bacterium]
MFGPKKVAIVDWDGTVSRTAEGWEGLTVPHMVSIVMGIEYTPDEWMRIKLSAAKDGWVNNTTPAIEELIAGGKIDRNIFNEVAARVDANRGCTSLEHVTLAVEEAERRGRVFANREEFIAENARFDSTEEGNLGDPHSLRSLRIDMGAEVPGAIDFIKSLHARGIKVYIVTAALESTVKVEVERFGLNYYVEEVIGDKGTPDSSKEVTIRRVVEENRDITDHPSEVLVVGDGGKEIGIGARLGATTVGVAAPRFPGISNKLAEAGAKIIVEDFSEGTVLLDYLTRCPLRRPSRARIVPYEEFFKGWYEDKLFVYDNLEKKVVPLRIVTPDDTEDPGLKGAIKQGLRQWIAQGRAGIRYSDAVENVVHLDFTEFHHFAVSEGGGAEGFAIISPERIQLMLLEIAPWNKGPEARYSGVGHQLAVYSMKVMTDVDGYASIFMQDDALTAILCEPDVYQRLASHAEAYTKKHVRLLMDRQRQIARDHLLYEERYNWAKRTVDRLVDIIDPSLAENANPLKKTLHSCLPGLRDGNLSDIQTIKFLTLKLYQLDSDLEALLPAEDALLALNLLPTHGRNPYMTDTNISKGFGKLEEKFYGRISRAIEETAGRKGPLARVLVVGAGGGISCAGIKKRFGQKAEIHSCNREEGLIFSNRQALRHKDAIGVPEKDLPDLMYEVRKNHFVWDAETEWPEGMAPYDVIIIEDSVLPYFRDKIGVINRLKQHLTMGGVLLTDFGWLHLGAGEAAATTIAMMGRIKQMAASERELGIIDEEWNGDLVVELRNYGDNFALPFKFQRTLLERSAGFHTLDSYYTEQAGKMPEPTPDESLTHVLRPLSAEDKNAGFDFDTDVPTLCTLDDIYGGHKAVFHADAPDALYYAQLDDSVDDRVQDGRAVLIWDDFRPLEGAPGRPSYIPVLNRWSYETEGINFNTSTKRDPKTAALNAREFKQYLRELDAEGRLPEGKLIVQEWGIGNTWYASVFLGIMQSSEYYDRLTYVLCDFSDMILAKARADNALSKHAGHIKFLQMDAADPDDLKKKASGISGNTMLIRHNELYDDLPAQELLYVDGAYFRLHIRPFLDATQESEEQKITSAKLAEILRRGDLASIRKLDPRFLMRIKHEERYERINDIAEYPYGKIIERFTGEVRATGKKTFRFTVNTAAMRNFEEALRLLHEAGYVQFNDYGFTAARITEPEQILSMPSYSKFRKSGNTWTSDVNFELFGLLADEIGIAIRIEPQEEYLARRFEGRVRFYANTDWGWANTLHDLFLKHRSGILASEFSKWFNPYRKDFGDTFFISERVFMESRLFAKLLELKYPEESIIDLFFNQKPSERWLWTVTAGKHAVPAISASIDVSGAKAGTFPKSKRDVSL